MARTPASRINIFPTVLSTSWVGVLFMVVLFNARTSSARALPNMSDHINDMFGTPNRTAGPVGEIQCYALPYGAIGILSHLLTYWTIAWVGFGKRPIWPWHSLTSSKFDIFLVGMTLATCIPIASISIHRCRLSWHFVLIGVWKLTTSVSLSCVTFHRAIITRREKKEQKATNQSHSETPFQQFHTAYDPHRASQPQAMYHHNNNTGITFLTDPNQPTTTNYHPLYWLILYLLGTIAGMTGLGALVYTSFRHNKDVRPLTYGFAIAIVIIPAVTACYFFFRHVEKSKGGYQGLTRAYMHTFGGALITFTVAFGFLSGIYSDLVLGAIAGKWSGAPSEDYAPLYWAWFIAKRFSMFAF